MALSRMRSTESGVEKRRESHREGREPERAACVASEGREHTFSHVGQQTLTCSEQTLAPNLQVSAL
jgi:hypothetical protein